MPKSEWQPQVNVLLGMKSQLAALQGSPAPSKGKSKGKKWQGKRVAYPRFAPGSSLYTMMKSNCLFWIWTAPVKDCSSNCLPTAITNCLRIFSVDIKLVALQISYISCLIFNFGYWRFLTIRIYSPVTAVYGFKKVIAYEQCMKMFSLPIVIRYMFCI